MRKQSGQSTKRDRKNRQKQSKPNRKKLSQPKQAISLASKLRLIFPDHSIFGSLGLHGNTKWLPSQLVILTLVWAMAGNRFVTDAFANSASACQVMFGNLPVTTYQGMMNALVHWTDSLMPVVFAQLQRSMRIMGGTYYCICGFVPIAFDGSRATVPRTAANEKAFCAQNYGNGSYAKATKRKGTKVKRKSLGTAHPQEPQIWITMLWHMGLRLPFCWKLGRSDSSERKHVTELLDEQEFPENTLFCGDAGFVGYQFWQQILDHGYDFMVRVGANVSLLADNCEYELQANGNVYCWPKEMRSKGKPIRLRLVQVKIGKANVWLLTSVLSEKQLSTAQMIAFYKMRWGIEVEFRGLKQTLDNAKMCCLNPSRSLVELHWSIAAMAVSELLAIREQLRAHDCRRGKSKSSWTPQRRSLAQTMRAIRQAINKPNDRPSLGKDLTTMLEQALTDSYKRHGSKKARHLPRPNKKALKQPKVTVLTGKERSRIREIESKTAA